MPANAIVESDRVNPQKFYGFYGGTFYVSTNGGADLHRDRGDRPADASNVQFKAVPGVEGDIWLAGGRRHRGLCHSTNSGATFTKVAT